MRKGGKRHCTNLRKCVDSTVDEYYATIMSQDCVVSIGHDGLDYVVSLFRERGRTYEDLQQLSAERARSIRHERVVRMLLSSSVSGRAHHRGYTAKQPYWPIHESVRGISHQLGATRSLSFVTAESEKIRDKLGNSCFNSSVDQFQTFCQPTSDFSTPASYHIAQQYVC